MKVFMGEKKHHPISADTRKVVSLWTGLLLKVCISLSSLLSLLSSLSLKFQSELTLSTS